MKTKINKLGLPGIDNQEPGLRGDVKDRLKCGVPGRGGQLVELVKLKNENSRCTGAQGRARQA